MNPYPIENVWEKGHYIARITGPHGRYVLEREFLNGTPHKARGILTYTPDDIGTLPAWLIRTPETRCGECGRPKSSEAELLAAHPHGWEITARGLTAAQMLEIWQMGPPGTPQSWTGETCPECSTPTRGEHCGECQTTNQGRQMAEALAGDKEDPF